MRVKTKSNHGRRRSGVPLAAGALAFLCLAGSGGAQPSVTMENFTVPLEYYSAPNESQPKTQLEGAKAEPLAGGLTLVTDGKLKNFATNGALTMLVETPQCIFDSAKRSVSSAELLQISTSDQSFSLQGRGFALTQSNSVLTISNRVHTVIRIRPGHRSFRP